MFSVIKSSEFEKSFRERVLDLCGKYKGVTVMDGKGIRGAKPENEDSSAFPIKKVSTWAVENGVSPGQEKSMTRIMR